MARLTIEWMDMVQPRKYRFDLHDKEARDLLELADKTATPSVLEGCSALMASPLVQKLVPSATTLESARVVQRLLECTLSLAFIARQANPKDIEASDAIAAGVLMGMVSTSPNQPFPRPGGFTVVKGSKESRQNLAVQWYGSAAVSNARGMRVYEHACLNAFRHYLHKVTDSGELRLHYARAYLSPPNAMAEDQTAPEDANVGTAADEVNEAAEGEVNEAAEGEVNEAAEDEVEAEGAEANEAECEEDAEAAHGGRIRGTTWLRRIGWGGSVAAAALLVGVPTVVHVWPERNRSTIQVVVETNLDRLVLDPDLVTFARGSYVTNQPIERVPPPPGLRDSCTGRWAWAHSQALRSIDADVTIARVDLTPLSHSAAVVGAQVHFDNTQTSSINGTYLTCPGGGGNLPPNTLAVNLDSGEVTFHPSGDEPATLNLQVGKGVMETLIVLGTSQEHFCRWRVELAINDGSRVRALTIGSSGYAFGPAASHPEVKPFETTGSLASKPYRYSGGEWKQGR